MSDELYEATIKPGNEAALNSEPRVIAALLRDPTRRRFISNLTASHFGTPAHAIAFGVVISLPAGRGITRALMPSLARGVRT